MPGELFLQAFALVIAIWIIKEAWKVNKKAKRITLKNWRTVNMHDVDLAWHGNSLVVGLAIVVFLAIKLFYCGLICGVNVNLEQATEMRVELQRRHIKLSNEMSTDSLHIWLMSQDEASTTDFSSLKIDRFEQIDILLDEFESRVGRDPSAKARSQESEVLDKYGPCWSKQGHCSE